METAERQEYLHPYIENSAVGGATVAASSALDANVLEAHLASLTPAEMRHYLEVQDELEIRFECAEEINSSTQVEEEIAHSAYFGARAEPASTTLFGPRGMIRQSGHRLPVNALSMVGKGLMLAAAAGLLATGTAPHSFGQTTDPDFRAGVNPGDRFFPFYQADADNFVGFAVSNYSDLEAELTFTAYDEEGSVLQLPNNPANYTLPAHAQLARLGKEIFNVPEGDEVSAWVYLQSSIPDIGAFFIYGNNQVSRADGANAWSFATPEINFLRLYEGPGAFENLDAKTTLYIVNPQDYTVLVTWNLGDRPTDPDKWIRIPSKGFVKGRAQDLLDTSAQIINEEGYVTLRAGNYIPGAPSLFGFETIELPDTIIGLNATTGIYSSSELRSAQLVNLPDYYTRLRVVNLWGDYNEEEVTVKALSSDGTELGSRVFELVARQYLDLNVSDIPGVQPGQIGSLVVQTQWPGWTGDVIFGNKDGAFAADLPLQGERFTRSIVSHVANGSGYFTGIAAQADKATDIDVRVFDETGNPIGEGRMSLGAGEKEAKVVPELVPSSAGLVGGYTELEADKPYVAQALFGDTNFKALTAVPPIKARIRDQRLSLDEGLFLSHSGCPEDPIATISKLELNADGEFQKVWQSNPLGKVELFTANYVGTGDIDHDSADELVVILNRGDVFVFEEGSQGEWSHLQKIDTGKATHRVFKLVGATLGDYDNDGRLEIITATDYVAKAWELTSSGFSEEWTSPEYPQSLYTVSVGDADGDGRNEVLLAARGMGLRIWSNTSSGDWLEKRAEEPSTKFSGNDWFDVAKVRDLDPSEENGPEIIAGGNFSRVLIYKHQDGEYKISYFSNPLQGFTHAVEGADVDGDGDLEVLVGGGFPKMHIFDRQSNQWRETGVVQLDQGRFGRTGIDQTSGSISVSPFGNPAAPLLFLDTYEGLTIYRMEDGTSAERIQKFHHLTDQHVQE